MSPERMAGRPRREIPHMDSQNRSILSTLFPGGHRNPPARSQTEERCDRTTGVAASLPLQTAHRDDRDLRALRDGHIVYDPADFL